MSDEVNSENAPPPQPFRMRMAYDPIEDDPAVEPLIRAADLEVRLAMRDTPRGFGFCHLFWTAKKKLLKSKYNIEWSKPAEMSPWAWFD